MEEWEATIASGLIVAALTALSNIAVTFYSVKNKMKKENEALLSNFTKMLDGKEASLKKELLTRQIDADLVARARIKWIQEVRKESSEGITNMNDLLRLNNVESIDAAYCSAVRQCSITAENTMYRILLYIGEDTIKSKQSKKSKPENGNKASSPEDKVKDENFTTTKLESTRTSNIGCNHLVISKIEEIIAKVREKTETLDSAFEELPAVKVLIEDIASQRNPLIGIPQGKFGTYTITKKLPILSSMIHNYFLENEPEAIKKEMNHLKHKKMSIKSNLRSIDKDLGKLNEDFTNMMREYLKIEWKEVTLKRS